MWQDYVTSAVSVALSYALIPQVIKGFKEKRPNISIQTGVLTTLGMYVMTYTFYSLDMDFSSVTSAVTGTLWAVLLGQSISYRKNNLENIVESNAAEKNNANKNPDIS